MDNTIIMRRKIDYVRNLENGLTKEVMKNKDINREVIGEADIQIFDEHGELTLEANTQNVIGNYAIKNAFYLAFMNMGALGANTTLGTNFGKIFLSNTPVAEDEFLPEIVGDIAGHSDIRLPFGKDHLYQGSVIPEGCFITPGKFQFAVSFGANTANKPFNTIFFGASPIVLDSPINSDNGFGYSPRKIEELEGSWDNIQTVKVADDKGNIYSVTQTTITQFSLLERGMRKALIKGGTTTITNSDNKGIDDAIFVPSTREFWVTTGMFGTVLIYDEHWIEKGKLDYTTTGYKQIAQTKNGKVIVSNNMTNTLHFFDAKTRVLEKTQPVSVPSGTSITDMYSNWDGEYIYIMFDNQGDANGREEHIYKVEATGLSESPICKNYTTQIQEKFPLPNNYGKNFFGSYMDTYLYKSFTEPGTMTKLAQTIEKKVGQTMRVVYTFSFQ